MAIIPYFTIAGFMLFVQIVGFGPGVIGVLCAGVRIQLR